MLKIKLSWSLVRVVIAKNTTLILNINSTRTTIKKVKTNLEKMLGGLNRGAMDSQAASQEAALFAMNYIPVSYTSSLNGGVYKDMPMIPDSTIPKNKKARRLGLAQQKKHQEMMQDQYDK